VELQGPALVLGSGGSSGARRWCLQPLEHLQASAAACGDWLRELGIEPGRCLHLAALPLHHVSGLMPLVRSRCWGAELRWLPPELLRRPAQLPQACPLPCERPVLLSLVPTQLQRLLDSPEALQWLRGCAVIWVGGAALPEDLAARARHAALPLAPCYGATETAAMVCALPPQRFLAGEGGCGPPLGDVELRLEGAEQTIALRSARLSPGWFEAGRLRRFADGQGWWRSGDAGEWRPWPAAKTRRNDGTTAAAAAGAPAGGSFGSTQVAGGAGHAGASAGCRQLADGESGPATISAAGAARTAQAGLLIRGRLDGAIHSGGETVFPEQVRSRLLTLIEAEGLPVAELLLLGESDDRWGERLVALVRWSPPAVAQHRQAGDSSLGEGERLAALTQLARTLPASQRPKRWLSCPQLESDSAGKWSLQHWRQWLVSHPAGTD